MVFSRTYKPTLKLIFCVVMLILFIRLCPQWISRIPVYNDFRIRIEQQSIEPTALFYTEEQHTQAAARKIGADIDSNRRIGKQKDSIPKVPK